MELNYIIIAHKNPDQLFRLVNQLNSPQVNFYIHIDKYQNINDFSLKFTDYPNVIFLNESEREFCTWGYAGMLKGTIKAIRKIIEDKRKGYVILLSGQCFPLKSNEFIKNFFDSKYGTNFINIVKLPNNWPHGGLDRIEDYALFLSNKKGDFIIVPPLLSKRIINFPYKKIISNLKYFKLIFLHINKIIVHRKFPDKFKFYGGSSWWALPMETIKIINDKVNSDPNILNYFEYSLLPEEIFFQSIIMSYIEEFKNIKFDKSQTFDDWSRPTGPSPAILTEKDYNKLISMDYLFARKFDLEIDTKLMNLLEVKINNE